MNLIVMESLEHSIHKKHHKKHISFKTDTNEIDTKDEPLSKLDILILNNGWNDKNENFIVSIGENAASYKYMHDQTANLYSSYGLILNMSMAILGVLLSADSLMNFSSSEPLRILQQILSFILALIVIMNNFLDYDKLVIEHKYSSNSFSILYHDIRNIMCTYRKDRPNAIKYIQNILKEYDHFEVSGPDISDSMLKKFKTKFKDSDISMPDITDKIQKIDIIIEPHTINDKFSINNQHNLGMIQDAFCIDGDLNENDNITVQNVKKYAGFQKHSDYEMSRFSRNIEES